MFKDKKEESEYMGNIWGWKISFLSLALIILMLALMGLRYCYLQKTAPQDGNQIEQTEYD